MTGFIATQSILSNHQTHRASDMPRRQSCAGQLANVQLVVGWTSRQKDRCVMAGSIDPLSANLHAKAAGTIMCMYTRESCQAINTIICKHERESWQAINACVFHELGQVLGCTYTPLCWPTSSCYPPIQLTYPFCWYFVLSHFV